MLAGDILRSCADKCIPSVGVGLVFSGDTFSQAITPQGEQTFSRSDWQKLDQLTKLPTRIELTIAKTKVQVGCWRYDIVGNTGFVVPVYLLDTNFLGNETWVKDITQNLYSSNWDKRICQEIVLGFGAVKMLRALGYEAIKCFHLNEGHTAFAPLALLEEKNWQDEEVRKACVFTTHTPIPEGHDKFSYEHAYHFAGDYLPWHIRKLAGENELSMTHLAISLSRTSFAVSQKHQAVSSHLFPDFKFSFVTNGVHHRNWTAPTIQNLFDKYLPGWYENPIVLKDAVKKIPDDAFWAHHQDAKAKLVRYVNVHLTAPSSLEEKMHPMPMELFDTETLTISLARRPVAYKRPLLLYQDLERFVRLGAGRLQIIQCGKSHPDDDVSQGFVRQIVEISKKFNGVLRIVYLENYSPKIARILVSGSDIWLNTPKKPLEASGTSGMKAALNGVLNFSISDGWWIEAWKANDKSGFTIGSENPSTEPVDSDTEDAESLYKQLQEKIIPLYYSHRSDWIRMAKEAITLGAHFNTHRVVDEYRAFWKN